MNQFHTPAEMVLFSNLAHWFEGGLLSIIVIIALLHALGYLKFKTAQLAWSVTILIAGSFLVLYMILHHDLQRIAQTWQFLMNDPQQRQHLIMGVLLTIAGLAELLSTLTVLKNKLWQFVFPLVLVIIGILFMVHNQHGTAEAVHESVIFHRYLGTALILSGVAKALEVVLRNRYRKIGYVWIIFMLITAGMLVTYREPDGAYNVSHSMTQQEGVLEGHH